MGETSLHAAIRAGHAAVVDKLLSLGDTHAGAVTQAGHTLLHYLGLYPRDKALQIFQALARRISDVNPLDGEGNTPLLYAYRNGAAALCKALVQSGAHLALPNKHGTCCLIQTLFSIAAGLCCFDQEVASKKLLYQLIGGSSQPLHALTARRFDPRRAGMD